jgi:class 3 adenylate cyclase
MLVCAQCGRENADDARFCSGCGSPLAAATSELREERKVVTILFADLVGFTSQAERLDPEDVRATLSPYYARLRTELERHGGTVEKFIGDAVMAVFGAPVAHEDDPERAVRAAFARRSARTAGSRSGSPSPRARRSSPWTRAPARARAWSPAMWSTPPRACRTRRR